MRAVAEWLVARSAAAAKPEILAAEHGAAGAGANFEVAGDLERTVGKRRDVERAAAR